MPESPTIHQHTSSAEGALVNADVVEAEKGHDLIHRIAPNLKVRDAGASNNFYVDCLDLAQRWAAVGVTRPSSGCDSFGAGRCFTNG